MWNLSTRNLEVILSRFSETESVFAADRVCVATLEGRSLLGSRDDVVVHSRRSGLPWFLRPLELISVPRQLVEFNSPAGILALARRTDDYYGIRFYSFTRALLPAVLSHLKSRGSDPAEIAGQDATYAELILDGDSPGEQGWVVLVRWNRDCPSDLVECLGSIDDLE